MSKKIGILGGDLRISKLTKMLINDGHSVEVDIENADIIIAGVPLKEDIVKLEEVFNKISGKIFVAGKISKEIYELADKNNVKVIDVLEDEEVVVLNTIPTAEGALQVAMEEGEITLHGSNCLVIGYGRIGKILSKMLCGIGANISVAARKKEDLATIEAIGYNKIDIGVLNNELEKYDFIFNTAPAMVIDKDRIDILKKECVIIDLASAPGGVDFEVAKEKKIKAILALRTSWKSSAIISSKVY